MKSFARRVFFFAFLMCAFCSVARAQNPEDAPLSDAAPTLPTPISPSGDSTAKTSLVQPEDAPLSDNAPILDNAPPVSGTPLQAHSHSHSSTRLPSGSDSFNNSHSLWNVAASFSGTENSFMRQALLSGVLVALFCSYLGLFIVLKRTVFVSVALAEMSSAGVALGLLLHFSPSWGAALFTVLGVVLFSLRISPRRVPHESYIGLLYCVAGALGILLLARSAEGETQMLTLLQGNILTGTSVETWQIAAAFALVALIHIAFHKEFVLVSFDRDQAATLGFRPALWEFLMFLTVGVVIAFSVRAVGVLLTTALLILPAMTALLWTNRMRSAWIVAAILAIIPIPLGLHFSLQSDSLPPSPLIVALSFLVLLPSLLFTAIRKK